MPYWRLAGLYFFYFAIVGVMSPYWGLYLKDLSFSAQQIAALSAVPFLTKLFAPNLWSWYADRYGRRLFVMRIGSCVAALVFVGVLFTTHYALLLGLMTLYALFWNAVLPQFESLTLSHLAERSHHYSKIRVWGSIGFIAFVLFLGWFFEMYGVATLPKIVLIVLFTIFILCCSLPEAKNLTSKALNTDFIGLLFRPHVLIFFSVLFFLQFSHGVYYVFYSIYLEDLGYSRLMIGILWTAGVLSEIVIFLRMHRLFARFSLYHLLSFSLFVTAVRWVVIGFFPQKIAFLLFAQALHAFSFGVAHAVAMEFIKKQFGLVAQGQGQAFYSAISFGAGASLGSFFSGAVWHHSPSLTFYCAALAAFFGWFLCAKFLRGKL